MSAWIIEMYRRIFIDMRMHTQAHALLLKYGVAQHAGVDRCNPLDTSR